MGQTMAPGAAAPVYGPCARLDYELELGIYIGQGNAAGEPFRSTAPKTHVFGICLLNDWSARDIQFWEMAPLGPFLAKNFATTVSPWIVTMDALAPYRSAWTRPADHPQPLAYLEGRANRAARRDRHPARGLAARANATRAARQRPDAAVGNQLPRTSTGASRRWSRTTRSAAAA